MSVWVGFLKTVVLIDPSGCGITRESRNGIDPSGFDSIQALGLDQVVDRPTHKNGNILDLIMIENWHND